LLLGFHGCDESVCTKVVSGKEPLKESRNPWDWLGFGCYFWENNYERALQWAKDAQKQGKIDRPAVIGAVLSLGYCLDLLDTDSIKQLRDGYVLLQKTMNITKIPENKDGNHALDCAVIEILNVIGQERGQSYDSVRAMFPEGNDVYPGAGFRDKNHIQICIRNLNCIKGFFLPRKMIKYK
jgi:hypothetical protein